MTASAGIGAPIPRKEDARLLTGGGRYTDDFRFDGETHAVVVRSPHAHARILRIDIGDARRLPGVLAVLTGRDADTDGLGFLPIQSDVPGVDGTGVRVPPRRILQTDTVRYVGDPVALVVAESREAAIDGAERVTVDYEPLPAVTDTALADSDDAPRVWAQWDSNLCVHWAIGDAAATDDAFRSAAHVIEQSLVNNRVIGNPMEPRVAVGLYDAASERYVLYSPSQGALKVRNGLASSVFRIPIERMRVVSPDVGGSFGLRGKWFPESAMVLWAAKRLQRPVRWRADRQETMLADPHGRDHVTRAALALDASGRILGLRIHTVASMGAYLSDLGPRTATIGGGQVAGTVYRVPAIDLAIRCVFTNNSPTDSYRGAGRPEAAYVMERLLDAAAARLGLTRDAIRRRNMLAPQALPHRNPFGHGIDSGRFEETMQLALAAAEWSGFESRRVLAARSGKLRGIGMGYYLESSGGLPSEWARVSIQPGGGVEARVGTFSHGQGHETTYAQVISEILGVPFDAIRLVQGDTDLIPQGSGTGASRSSQMGGVAVLRCARAVLDRAVVLASRLLEADAGDISRAPEGFVVTGTDRRVSWQQLAGAAAPGELEAETLYERSTAANFPNGCHIAEVEVDPETGCVRIVRYTAIDDSGRLINPLVVHGQAHGAVVMGIGQALHEHVVYDDQGQLVSGSFLDYAIPRADDLPFFDVRFNEVPNPANELGVKGAGEGGTCGAPPALVGAVLDALRDHGVEHLDMPLTPERVWRALRNTRSGGIT